MALPVLVPSAPLVPVAAASTLTPILVGGGLIALGGGVYALSQTGAAAGQSGGSSIGRRIARRALKEGINVANKWNEWIAERVPELMEQGLSHGAAMDQARDEYRQRNQNSEDGEMGEKKPATSKLVGAGRVDAMRLEVPYMLEAGPDLAAAWDVAEGILDYLLEESQGRTGAEALRRRAASAYRRAHGGSPGDQMEQDLGQSLGEALVLVMIHRGITPQDWINMLPPDLMSASGAPPSGGEPGPTSGGNALGVFGEQGGGVPTNGAQSKGSSALNAFSDVAGEQIGKAIGTLAGGAAQGVLSIFDED